MELGDMCFGNVLYISPEDTRRFGHQFRHQFCTVNGQHSFRSNPRITSLSQKVTSQLLPCFCSFPWDFGTLEAGRISKVNQLDLPRITEVADEEQACCTCHSPLH